MSSYFKARDELVKMYINSLEEGIIPWEKMWQTNIPENGITGKKYRGINNLILSYVALQRGYKDNRWCTYLQISKNKWKLKDAKGQGVCIEYAGMKNKKNNKVYTFEEYKKIINEFPEKESEFSMRRYNYTVFNADLIEGIEKNNDNIEKIISNDYISNIIKNIDVKYQEKGDEAYYNLIADEVVIPPSNTFKNTYAYYSTQLHEIAHATGHNTRLNRDMSGEFKSEAYAKEELRAEISSSFLMQKLGLEYDERHLTNHKAYVKGWLEIIKDKPQELFLAISDANKIVAYIEEKSLSKEQNISKEIEEMEMEYA